MEPMIVVATQLDSFSLFQFLLVRPTPNSPLPSTFARLINLAADMQDHPRYCQRRYLFTMYARACCVGMTCCHGHEPVSATQGARGGVAYILLEQASGS